MPIEKDLLYIHLINGEVIIARYTMEDDHTMTVNHPMTMDLQSDGTNDIVNLLKYLPFSSDQYLVLKKEHIVDTSPVTVEFEKYYYNSWGFHTLFTERQTETNLIKLNRTLEDVLSKESQDFTEAVRVNLKRIPQVVSTKVH